MLVGHRCFPVQAPSPPGASAPMIFLRWVVLLVVAASLFVDASSLWHGRLPPASSGRSVANRSACVSERRTCAACTHVHKLLGGCTHPGCDRRDSGMAFVGPQVCCARAQKSWIDQRPRWHRRPSDLPSGEGLLGGALHEQRPRCRGCLREKAG